MASLPEGTVVVRGGSAAQQPQQPQPRPGPTKEAAELQQQGQSYARRQLSDPIDIWLYENSPLMRKVIDYYNPEPQKMGPGGASPVVTTEGMGFFERLGKLARTGAQDAAVGIRSLPRNLYEWGRGDISVGEGPWYLGTLKSTPTGEPTPEWATHMPTTEEVRSDVNSKLSYPETRPVDASGRIFQRGVTGATGGALIPGAGAAGAIGGAVGETVSATGEELGLPPSVTVPLGFVTGALGPAATTKAFSMATEAAEAVPRQMMGQAARGATQAQIDEALALTRAVQGQGVNLTIPLALQQVTQGGTRRAGSLQRFVEEAPGGERLQRFQSQVPDQIDQQMRQQIEAIAGGPLPTGEALQNLPGQVQQGAQQGVRRMERGVTAASDPNYEAALGRSVEEVFGPRHNEWMNVLDRPQIARAYRMSQNTRQSHGEPPNQWLQWLSNEDGTLRLNIADVPSARQLDDIVQELDNIISEGTSVTGKLNSEARAAFAEKRALMDLATSALPQYQTARFAHGQMAAPVSGVQQGPLGGLMRDAESAETQGKQQMQALLPENPENVDPQQVAMAVRTTQGGRVGGPRRVNPALRQSVAKHIEGVWDEASQMTSGEARTGPTKFRAKIAGNTAQGDNLNAAVTELAGPEVAAGFQTLLRVMETQRWHQPPGSPTASRLQMQQQIGASRLGMSLVEAARTAATGGRNLLYRGFDALEEGLTRRRAAANAEHLTDLMIDPNLADTWRQLATMDPTSPNAQRLVRSILGQVGAQVGASGVPAMQ